MTRTPKGCSMLRDTRRLVHQKPNGHPEQALWCLVKDGYCARAVLRTLPHGLELRIDVDGSLLWSEQFRQGGPVAAVANAQRQSVRRSRLDCTE